MTDSNTKRTPFDWSAVTWSTSEGHSGMGPTAYLSDSLIRVTKLED